MEHTFDDVGRLGSIDDGLLLEEPEPAMTLCEFAWSPGWVDEPDKYSFCLIGEIARWKRYLEILEGIHEQIKQDCGMSKPSGSEILLCGLIEKFEDLVIAANSVKDANFENVAILSKRLVRIWSCSFRGVASIKRVRESVDAICNELGSSGPPIVDDPKLSLAEDPRTSFLDGISIKLPHLARDELVNKIWSTAQANRFVLMCSPPATGKTSLLQLILKRFPEQCRYVSFFCDTSSMPATQLIQKHLDGDTEVTVLIDDAQERYSETDFWAKLIKVPEEIEPSPKTRFIISATYKLDSAINSPIFFSDLYRISREHLLVAEEESKAVLQWCFPRSWQYPELVDKIVLETCGHIGAAMAAAVCIRAHFRDAERVNKEDLIQFYFSAPFLQGLHRCFGNFSSTPNCVELRKLLADSIFTNQPPDLDLPQYTEEDKMLLIKMRRF